LVTNIALAISCDTSKVWSPLADEKSIQSFNYF
jgi:hypothetical protein